MLETAKKALFFVLAWPLIARARRRLALFEHHRFDELAARLRRVEPFAWSYLRKPGYLAGCVDRRPGRGRRACLERSLLLLDLWSRCGLEPKLRLGMVRVAGERRFHAWVTVGKDDLDPPPSLYREVWSG